MNGRNRNGGTTRVQRLFSVADNCRRRHRPASDTAMIHSILKREGRSPRTGGNRSEAREERRKRRTCPTGTRCRRLRIPPILLFLTPQLRLKTEAVKVRGAKNPLTLGDKCRRSDLCKLPDELGRLEGRKHTQSIWGVHQRETHRSTEHTVPETNTGEKESSR